MDADVAIVGTGPGGGMAACMLAATGLKTIVLEKSALPRPKACGGAMPDQMRQIISWNFDDVIECRVSLVKNLLNHSAEAILQEVASPILLVNRARFDHHFIERALALGKDATRLREGFRVSHVREDETGVTIRGLDGSEVRARYLIAADGAYSQTARSLGLDRGPSACVALDAEVEVTPEVYATEKDRVTFNYYCLPNGYGWIFPKAGILSCGVGAWKGRVDLRQALDDFLARSFPKGSIRSVRISGQAIPLYSGSRTLATRRVFLAGDAASLVDPILGEGIRFAVISGGLAAKLVHEHFESGADISTVYQQEIARLLGRSLDRLLRFVSPVFLQAPDFYYRRFIREGNSYVSPGQQIAATASAFPAARQQ